MAMRDAARLPPPPSSLKFARDECMDRWHTIFPALQPGQQ